MFIFFSRSPATSVFYTLSLHDALPICDLVGEADEGEAADLAELVGQRLHEQRSEEHTSELQSRQYLVCRLLLEKKKVRNRKNIRIKITKLLTLSKLKLLILIRITKNSL